MDPALKPLEGFKRVDGRWVMLAAHSDSDRVRAEPFEAVELELVALWT